MADDETTIDALGTPAEAEHQLLAAQASWLDHRRRMEETRREHRSHWLHLLHRPAPAAGRPNVAQPAV
jgi:hypothetical protein